MSARVFECVPNVSEGRDAGLIDACAAAVSEAGALLAHRTSDPVHHRSVLTFFGTRETAIAASVALARVTTARIDLRAHGGEHPRIGALDVLPFVPMLDATIDEAAGTAREAAAAIYRATGVPSLFYGAAARDGRSLPDVRRGQFEGLAERAASGERPDVGDALFHPSAGAIAVGARPVLIAFNVVLGTGDVALARRIARRLRERNGGLRTLRAIGVALDNARTQVSFNVTDHAATPLDRLVHLVRVAAEREDVAVLESELIGLAPRDAVANAAARALGVSQLRLRSLQPSRTR